MPRKLPISKRPATTEPCLITLIYEAIHGLLTDLGARGVSIETDTTRFSTGDKIIQINSSKSQYPVFVYESSGRIAVNSNLQKLLKQGEIAYFNPADPYFLADLQIYLSEIIYATRYR